MNLIDKSYKNQILFSISGCFTRRRCPGHFMVHMPSCSLSCVVSRAPCLVIGGGGGLREPSIGVGSLGGVRDPSHAATYWTRGGVAVQHYQAPMDELVSRPEELSFPSAIRTTEGQVDSRQTRN